MARKLNIHLKIKIYKKNYKKKNDFILNVNLHFIAKH
jgi:hypothetical protein